MRGEPGVSHRKGRSVILFLIALALSSFLASPGEAFQIGVEGSSSTKVNLPAGQSCLIDTPVKVRSASVNDPAVAEATIVNQRQLRVTGKRPGSTLLVYWTEGNIPASVDVTVWAGSGAREERVSVPSPDTPAPPLLFAGIEPKEAKEIVKRDGLPEGKPFLVAVLPVENLSGKPGPLKEIRRSLTDGLRDRGIAVLPDRELDRFMARHRMRYTGGINRELAQAFLRETGTNGVLVTALEFLSEGPPPKISFLARLVTTGDNPTILWMKSLGMSGDDHPGILGLGLIFAPEEILRKAVGTTLDSLARSVPDGMSKVPVRSARGGKYRPKRFYRSPDLNIGKEGPVTVAVIPFLNTGLRKNAGLLMEQHFVDRLAQVENVRVIEPGVVREVLLQQRVIMQGGVSVPQAALLFSMLEADLLLAGNVAEYQDSGGGGGGTKVDFSVVAFDAKSRLVVWSSWSDNRGDDGVFFFDAGEVRTASVMVSQMIRSVVERLFAGKG
jgi:hypothetical protein